MTYAEALSEALEAVQALEDCIPNTPSHNQDHRTVVAMLSSLNEMIDAEAAIDRRVKEEAR